MPVVNSPGGGGGGFVCLRPNSGMNDVARSDHKCWPSGRRQSAIDNIMVHDLLKPRGTIGFTTSFVRCQKNRVVTPPPLARLRYNRAQRMASHPDF